jgi:hypothetical protein
VKAERTIPMGWKTYGWLCSGVDAIGGDFSQEEERLEVF